MAVLALFFALGAASLVAQTILVREFLAVVHGTELALGILFACWLFCIGCGAALGARWAATAARPRLRLHLWASLGVLAPLAQIELVRHAARLLDVAPGLVISWRQTLALALPAMMPFCLMIGATFPLGCRLWREQSSRGVGILYMVESAGAVTGGLLFSFLLVARVGHLVVCAGAAAVLACTSAFLHAGRGRAAGLTAGTLIALGLPLVARWDEASRRGAVAATLAGQEVVAVFDTPYEQVAIARMADQLTLYGGGLPVATVPDPYESRAVVYNLLAQVPAPRRVLIVGNPATGLVEELIGALEAGPAAAADGEATAVTIVFPDARALRALAAQLGTALPRTFDSRRARFAIEDPRAYLRSARETFDLVFVDAPQPTAAYTNRLFTAEFFAAAGPALGPAGVIGFRLGGAGTSVGREVSDLTMSVRKALATSFSDIVATSGDDHFFFASRSADRLTSDARLIDARLRAYPGARAYRGAILLGYQPDRLARFEQQLGAGRGAVTNTDDRPSSYHYGSVLWDRLSSHDRAGESLLTGAFAFVRAIGRTQVAAALALLVALWLALRRAARSRAAEVDASLVVFVAGASAMALDLVLLLRYQSMCGALYQRLAAMAALFMAGLAVGSGVAGRIAPGLRRPAAGAAAVLVGTALLALVLSLVLPALGAQPPWVQQLGYAAGFAASGLGLGAGFPISAQMLLAGSGGGNAGGATARAGGLMDAMDHLGAALGALVTGTLVLPAIGARATLHVVAAIAAVVGCLLVAWPPARRGTGRISGSTATG